MAEYCKAKLEMGSDVVYTRCVACLFTMPEEVFQKFLTENEYKRY